MRVENRGYPGDTVAQSLARWAGHPAPDLLIVALGYGDLAAHTPTQSFSDTLGPMVQAAQARGTSVFILVPPLLRTPVSNQAIEAYRTVERGVASVTGASDFEGSKAAARIKAPATEGAAQSPAVYQAMAADMTAYIKVVDRASPQTGQAGSGDSRTVRASAARAS